MKKFVYYIVICLVTTVLLIPLNSYAHESKGERIWMRMKNTTPEERADFQTNRMNEFLNLSDEQTEKVWEINLKYSKERQQIFESEGSRQEKRDRFREFHEHKRNELKSIFSEEQYKEYCSKRKEMKRRMKERRNQ